MALPEGSGFLRTISAQPNKQVENLWQFSRAGAGCALGTGAGITLHRRPGPGAELSGKGDDDESKNVLCAICDSRFGSILKVSSDTGRAEPQIRLSVI